jgi:uncharacterized membrane protein YgdD (TMEM256/DUF423 family)
MNKLDKRTGLAAAILGGITIAIGAFGAHGLKQLVDADAIASFETGVRYQMYHVIVLLVVSFARPLGAGTKLWVLRFFCFGILLFSGSIYLLALKEVLPFSVRFLGPITPFGGLLFILGWLRLGYGIFKLKSEQN